MSDSDNILQRQAIRELIGKYYYGIDGKQRELILDCFTDDAVYEFVLEGRVLRGMAELRQLFGGGGQPSSAAAVGYTSHAVASQQITLDGGLAHADTFVVAHLVEGAVAGPGAILVRGLRYTDDLVRTEEEGWRIAHRRHHSLWQYEAKAVSPDLSKRSPVLGAPAA